MLHGRVLCVLAAVCDAYINAALTNQFHLWTENWTRESEKLFQIDARSLAKERDVIYARTPDANKDESHIGKLSGAEHSSFGEVSAEQE